MYRPTAAPPYPPHRAGRKDPTLPSPPSGEEGPHPTLPTEWGGNPVLDLLPHALVAAAIGRGRGQDRQERLPVIAAQDAVVQDHDRAAIAAAPDQAPEAL